MMIIKKIFDGVFDEDVHSDFLKFSRGKYENRYLLEGKKQASKWAVKAGPEFANFFVRRCLEKVSETVAVKGVIVTTRKIDDVDFDIKKVSNFQGVRKMQIDTETEPSKILEMMDEHSRAFFALSFKGDDFVLKIKAKAPKNSKPGKDGEEARPEFCSLKTEDKAFVDELFFGVGEFKEVAVNHAVDVTGIVYPADMDSLKPTEIREQSKKEGILNRRVIVDGIEKNTQAEFTA